MKQFLPLSAVLFAAVPLAGCISFTPKPPAQLLTLHTTAPIAVGQTQTSAAARSIVVQVPATPAALGTVRIPVMASANAITYVKDAAWSEPPARLFARLLSDTVTSRSGLVVVSGVQSLSDPSSTLSGELRMFGIDAAGSSAVVIYDASLVRAGQTAVEKRRFEARVPVTAINSLTVGPALDTAANQLAVQVADWVRMP